MSYEKTFSAAYPRSQDFTKTEYDAAQDEIQAAARATGYRLAGFRLGFAIFTTKEESVAADVPVAAATLPATCSCSADRPVEPANPQGDALG